MGSPDCRVWSEQCEQEKADILKAIVEDAVLYLPDLNRPFVLETDASDIGIAGILTQVDASGRNRPVEYASKALNETEMRWNTREREAYAIVFCVRRWAKYLGTKPFTVVSDHESLSFLWGSESRKLERWAAYLSPFDMTCRYRSGGENHVADLLSRDVD